MLQVILGPIFLTFAHGIIMLSMLVTASYILKIIHTLHNNDVAQDTYRILAVDFELRVVARQAGMTKSQTTILWSHQDVSL